MDDAGAILNALALPAVLVNQARRVSHINAAAETLLGQGLLDRHFTAGLRHPQLTDAIDEALTARASKSVRYFHTRQGRTSEFDVNVVPVDLTRGPAVIVSFVDVTHIEEAGLIRRDFVANVSHELKTPLTAMAGFIETLRGAARDDPGARERFLGIMARETERMNRLVNDLLHLTRVESGERSRPTELVDMADILRMALTRMRGLSEEAGVEVEEDIGDEPMLVPGDADQLMQVFLNLIENALKYGPSGKRITLRLAAIPHEPTLRVPAVQAEVIDYGEGIDAIHLPRLTERFYRVDDHRAREMGGTGLGLAIVKHIVNRHRGRLKIESQPGQGTRFTVVIPSR